MATRVNFPEHSNLILLYILVSFHVGFAGGFQGQTTSTTEINHVEGE